MTPFTITLVAGLIAVTGLGLRMLAAQKNQPAHLAFFRGPDPVDVTGLIQALLHPMAGSQAERLATKLLKQLSDDEVRDLIEYTSNRFLLDAMATAMGQSLEAQPQLQQNVTYIKLLILLTSRRYPMGVQIAALDALEIAGLRSWD